MRGMIQVHFLLGNWKLLAELLNFIHKRPSISMFREIKVIDFDY